MTEQYGPTPTSQGIRGYRNLDGDEIELVNKSKQVEESVAEFWRAVQTRGNADPRWLAVARTHFQEGFSALIRSVTKPSDSFESN